MPCDQHQVPLGNNAKSFRIIDDWYLREAILLALILNFTGQEFVPGWRGNGKWFERLLARSIGAFAGDGAAIATSEHCTAGGTALR